MENIYIKILILSLMVFVINIPFGYWREGVKRMSIKWFFYIHAPIPFVVIFRFFFDVGYIWYSYPFTILLYFIGQFTGNKIAKKRLQKIKQSSKENVKL